MTNYSQGTHDHDQHVEVYKLHKAMRDFQSPSDKAIDALEAKMQPIQAAHRVAACLDTIARLLPLLSAEAQNSYVSGMPGIVDGYADMLQRQARAIRAASPIEPVTDEERQEVWENIVDCANDLSSRDRAEMVVESWTDADWRYEADVLKAYLLDDLQDVCPGEAITVSEPQE